MMNVGFVFACAVATACTAATVVAEGQPGAVRAKVTLRAPEYAIEAAHGPQAASTYGRLVDTSGMLDARLPRTPRTRS